MPILIDSKPCKIPSEVGEFISEHPQFQNESRRLKSMHPIQMDPQEPYIFVHQMEAACVASDDPKVKMLGIDSMTTCCSIVIRHTGSKALGAGHFDGNDTKFGLDRIIQDLQRLTNNWASLMGISNEDLNSRYCYEVHMIGGFEDGRCISKDVIMQLLECLDESELDLHLKTACIFETNTFYRDGIALPCITGLICDVRSGRILPAEFSFQGPLEEIRRLRFAMRPPMKMYLVYSSVTRVLEISPYEWTISDETILQLLGLNTNSFLHYWSTSPLAEKPNFVPALKSALKFLMDNRGSLFCSGRSYKFVRADSDWKLVE